MDRCLIVFDLDTKCLENSYHNPSWQNAYADIRRVLNRHNIEDHIVRLAQKARAAGIHLILATQRPDAKIFSGLIRSNIPARIALTVQRGTESTIILDETGAEHLLGKGDMLVKAKPGGEADRGHGVAAQRSDQEAVLRERAAK